MFERLYKWIFLGCFLLALMLSGGAAIAQTGDIRGYVYEEASGEPMIFTTVFLEGTSYGAATDANGFFSLSKIPPGSYTLMSTYIGYDTVRVDVEVEANKIITKRLFLEESTIQIKTVDISAERQEKESEVQVSVTKVTPKNIKQLPTIGGEPDLAQYLQVLPGVIFTGDQGGQLYIRGGSPIQTKFLLDNTVVYNPLHSIGLFSVYETEAIRNVEVLTGGFNAEYGGRISAVVDVTTRDGNKKEFKGKVAGNPFLAKAVFEGPIVKLKENGSSASFILTGKHSYLDKTSTSLYEYVDSSGIPYGFTDVYGKLAISSGTGSRFSLFGFNFKDQAQFREIADIEWQNFGFGADFTIVPGRSNALINGNLSYSDYIIEMAEANTEPRFSEVNGFNLGIDFLYFIPNGDFKFGFDINGFKTNYEFFNQLGNIVDQEENTTELGAFFKYTRKFNKVVIEPSIRFQYYGSLGAISPEPRLGLKVNATRDLRFKMAGGIYSQNLISSKSDRDVVNLFTGFLSGPEQRLMNTDGEEATTKLQRSVHAIFGVEYDLTDYLELNVEPYYKLFTQLINVNRNKLFASDPDFMIEEGKAYGLDVLLKYEYKRYFLWVAYSLGYVDRFDGEQTYNPHFDRRHNLNVVGAYTFGKNNTWEASVRWSLGSGFPFTRTQGFYEQLFFGDGVTTDYTTANGNLGILYEEDLNAGRLPWYHRLDASLKKQFYISTDVVLEANVSVTNLYDRENIFYFDRVRFERVNQLPILPSAGLSLSF